MVLSLASFAAIKRMNMHGSDRRLVIYTAYVLRKVFVNNMCHRNLDETSAAKRHESKGALLNLFSISKCFGPVISTKQSRSLSFAPRNRGLLSSDVGNVLLVTYAFRSQRAIGKRVS